MNKFVDLNSIFRETNCPHVIMKNPVTEFNLTSTYPNIHPSVFIGPFSSIIGDVTIEENVFIACNAVIRCDEGSPFFIGKNTNIQDGVILHGLAKEKVLVNNEKFSIYIGNSVTCSHGSIIHGPCCIHDNVFVGFNSIVFFAIIGEGTYISPNSLVSGSVKIAPNKFIPSGAVINSQEKADALDDISDSQKALSIDVQKSNSEFPSAYKLLLDKNQCSCGLNYNIKSNSSNKEN